MPGKTEATPCSICPNKTILDIFGLLDAQVYQRAGKAEVLLTQRGDVYYSYTTSNFGRPGSTAQNGSLNARVVACEYSKLHDSIENCSQPENIRMPKPGVLGKLGLTDTISTCPAICSEMDPTSAESVEQYFVMEGVEQWQ